MTQIANQELTHIWKRRIPAEDAELWEGQLYGASENTAVFLQAAGKATATAMIYLTDSVHGDPLLEQFGGRVSRIDPDAWKSAGAETKTSPIRIRDRLILTMSEDEAELSALRKSHPQRTILQIPAQMAFGTGSHATTATCLRMLTDLAGEQSDEWSMLDMGTGSGVVAFAARVFGANPVEALDNDATAVRVAEGNAARNGLSGISFGVADLLSWKAEKTFDVVVANIFSEILIKGAEALVSAVKPGGTLILSGMLKTQMPEVLKRFEGSGMKPLHHVIRGRWATACLEAPIHPDGR